jgi:hypothetical protein
MELALERKKANEERAAKELDRKASFFKGFVGFAIRGAGLILVLLAGTYIVDGLITPVYETKEIAHADAITRDLILADGTFVPATFYQVHISGEEDYVITMYKKEYEVIADPKVVDIAYSPLLHRTLRYKTEGYLDEERTEYVAFDKGLEYDVITELGIPIALIFFGLLALFVRAKYGLQAVTYSYMNMFLMPAAIAYFGYTMYSSGQEAGTYVIAMEDVRIAPMTMDAPFKVTYGD